MIPFYSDCVSWPPELMPALHRLCDEGVLISRETFRRRVRPPIATADSGWDEAVLRPPSDWATHYRRVPGHPIYFMVNSCIEYVFATEADIQRLNECALEAYL